MTSSARTFHHALRVTLLGATLLGLASCAASTLPRVTSPAERLQVARRLSNDGQCGVAIELYKTYIATSAGSADVDEAIYLLGLCYLKIKDPASAAIEFERLIRDYPESDSAAAASYQLGEALYAQTRPIDFDQEFTSRAIRQWQGYLRAFPGDAYNARAEARVLEARTRLARKAADTADLYLKLRLWDPARIYYRQVVEDYADTPVVPDALIGLAVCDVEEGKTAEARARLEELRERYPGTPLAARAGKMLRDLPQ